MADDAALLAAAAALVQGQSATLPQYSLPQPTINGPKYQQLLQVLEELGRDIRPTYTNNKICQERLKRLIVHARILVRECLLEAEKERTAQNTKIAAEYAASDKEREKEKAAAAKQ